MSKQMLFDNTVLVGDANGAIDVSGDANQVMLAQTVEQVDTTTFSDTVRKRLASLRDGSFSMRTFIDDTNADPWAQIRDALGDGDTQVAWIQSNASMAEADDAMFGKYLQTSQEAGGQVGEAHMLEINGAGADAVVTGQVLQQDESLTVTGNSTGFQFGAIAAGETLYAGLWALTTTAGTLDAKIVSDDNSGFTSATDRITFTQITTSPIAYFSSVEGAITDDWWRFEYTIATGPYTVVCIIGKV